MLEALLKLIDRLIELKKYRAERLHKTFQDILDPAFADLMVIHQNYLMMFDQVKEKLAAIGEPNTPEAAAKVLDVAEYLRQRRVEFEPVRQKLAALARELGSTVYGGKPSLGSDEVDEFVAAVIQYFPTARIVGNRSRATVLLAAIQGAVRITPQQIDRYGKSLPELVESTIEDCRMRWTAVCDSYARMKLAL